MVKSAGFLKKLKKIGNVIGKGATWVNKNILKPLNPILDTALDFVPGGSIIKTVKNGVSKGLDFVDYDSPDTIDTAALHIFAEEIFACKELHCPTYDFMTGKISGYRTLSVGENDIFIFEGIQACYPNVKDMLSDHGSASIFIAPLSNVSAGGEEFAPNRLRLMRRLVRDYHFRGASAEFTFKLWQGVRENERKNIFPYAEESDYKVDSAMAYEVGVLKPFLCEILSSFDPKNEFAAKAEEILQSVKNVETIPGELITDNYLYSEFV